MFSGAPYSGRDRRDVVGDVVRDVGKRVVRIGLDEENGLELDDASEWASLNAGDRSGTGGKLSEKGRMRRPAARRGLPSFPPRRF